MKHTFTAVYFLLSALYIVFMEQLSGFMGAGIKALPVILLMFLVSWRLAGVWRSAMVVALLFSAGGDILLSFSHGSRHSSDLFLAGLGSFLMAQLVYAGLFWTHRTSGPGRVGLVIFAFVFMSVAGLLVVPYTGDMQAPVMAYILAIGAMLMGAAICDRPVNRLFAGALLFALSDLVIAVNKFIMPFAWSGIVIMATYYMAQYFIVVGVLAWSDKH
ncbi:lysoplasmalogenase [Endozoicomonas euniceicola]|uniref:Lysoplasmalogenase n=1 Tax=Endozoicomonas euniceicola TaxID=1234143 RepID=A0ABY6H2K6_9GAMM|nr:lysoplasmalogenase [Endozoicomonas euniceicola]UYM18476.1 lysoplasmalogenase [Endozoicomonas euniceicola]